MSTEYDEKVLDYWWLAIGEYLVKLKQDDGLECESELKSTMPARSGSFILSNSKRIMNNFIREIEDV